MARPKKVNVEESVEKVESAEPVTAEPVDKTALLAELQEALGVGKSGVYDRITNSAMNRAYLMKGMSCKLVEILQKALGIDCTGLFDDNTKKAVIAFQKAHGVNPDGIVGSETMKHIFVD